MNKNNKSKKWQNKMVTASAYVLRVFAFVHTSGLGWRDAAFE